MRTRQYCSYIPFPYIHIGGDECPTTQWTTNEDCLRRVQEEGLSGVEQLQSWLVEELGTYLKEKHGKDIVVWDELLSHWSSDNSVKPVIMAWNSIGKSSEAASKGFKSIVSPYSHLYLDFMQVPADQTLIDEVYYGGWGDSHVNTIEEAYGLNPVSSLAGREEYCMGVQGNLWAETLNDNTELEYQLLPRMLALSETGWLPSSKKLGIVLQSFAIARRDTRCAWLYIRQTLHCSRRANKQRTDTERGQGYS